MEAHNLANVLSGLNEMDFAKITDFNDGHAGAFWSDNPGTSPWEHHPDTDELLMCLEGSVEIHVLTKTVGTSTEDDITRITLTAGEFTVVPKDHWHRHHATAPFREFYITPGASNHSMDADPRVSG